MNLQAKFALLVLGVVLLPPLMVASVFLLQAGFGVEETAPYTSIVIQRVVYRLLPEYLENEDTDVFSVVKNKNIGIMLYENGETLYSSIPEGLAEESAVNYHEYPFETAGVQNKLVIIERRAKTGTRGMPKMGFALISGTVLLFLSIMAVFIIRSIDRSIKNLERATQEIASGNMDYELVPVGNDAFSSLTNSFNLMRDRLKEETARRSRFIMGVSHDLKTPLALIEGYADAVLDGHADTPEKLEKYLSIVKEKSFLLEQRIVQLIEFINMETGQWKFHLQKINLSDFFENLSRVYKEEGKILNYEFFSKLDLAPDLWVNFDEDLVRRVFDNLIQNAVLYSDEYNKWISLEAEQGGADVKIRISNKGKGISKDEQKLIFEPFYRGNSSRNEKGFGLGLSSVKSVVESHGWEIELESVPGGLTAFTVRIPLS